MFKKLKNLETAFQHVRIFSIAIVLLAFAAVCFMAWLLKSESVALQKKVYVLSGNTAWSAKAVERAEYLPLAARGHVRAFHELFFTLDPDEKVNKRNLSRALYLADNSARKVYDSLSVSGYYASIIAGNISQRLNVDSVQVDTRASPYHFRCYATLHIIRSTSQVAQSLITEGDLREVERSDNNLLGFLIEHWSTIENKVLTISNH
ncbi:conjugative transposon protein TraK [Mucilaginibacter gossypii]|uniref:Bacteroides conjugative transposon TraK protein n=1 Tax=Mucilaginibacter gossypii TaxID=551996 RepID=A0A1G8NLH4_9SPHI|nr:conjugative transposon protein TraK [Mucilaginibacter gossypii]SDI81053.1 Bacteroides conjugative transposon TraK protein [Mucilaginibacter gossypii]